MKQIFEYVDPVNHSKVAQILTSHFESQIKLVQDAMGAQSTPYDILLVPTFDCTKFSVYELRQVRIAFEQLECMYEAGKTTMLFICNNLDNLLSVSLSSKAKTQIERMMVDMLPDWLRHTRAITSRIRTFGLSAALAMQHPGFQAAMRDAVIRCRKAKIGLNTFADRGLFKSSEVDALIADGFSESPWFKITRADHDARISGIIVSDTSIHGVRLPDGRVMTTTQPRASLYVANHARLLLIRSIISQIKKYEKQ